MSNEVEDLATEAALCTMIVSNPGDVPRPDRWKMRVNNCLRALVAAVTDRTMRKDSAYYERNHLVAVLARIYPSGIKDTETEGWSSEWRGCVYIDFPWGQGSWHYAESHAHLFEGLPPYAGDWDGTDTETKYAKMREHLK